MDASFGQVAATGAFHLGLALLAGVLLSQWEQWRTPSSWPQSLLPKLELVFFIGWGLATVGCAVSLWLQAAAMGEVPLLHAGPSVWAMITTTDYGKWGMVRLVLLALLAAMYMPWLHRWPTGKGIASGILVWLGIALARVLTSHAAEHGTLSMAIAIEWLHLVAISVWVGGVTVAGWAVLPFLPLEKAVDRHAAARYLHDLSTAATAALAGILVTGAYNTYRVYQGAERIAGLPYTTMLALKLALVVLAIGLGGFNRFIGFPAVINAPATDPSSRAMSRAVAMLRVESAILAAAVMAAAVLIGQAPPSAG